MIWKIAFVALLFSQGLRPQALYDHPLLLPPPPNKSFEKGLLNIQCTKDNDPDFKTGCTQVKRELDHVWKISKNQKLKSYGWYIVIFRGQGADYIVDFKAGRTYRSQDLINYMILQKTGRVPVSKPQTMAVSIYGLMQASEKDFRTFQPNPKSPTF